MKITSISNFLYKKNKGQTLIEAIVTLGIALVIITSVVVLINASNRRANQARQATQASKLAQEGMEIVRNIRDVNGDELVRVGVSTADPDCANAGYCKWSDLYTELQGSILAYLEYNCEGNDHWCLFDPPVPDLVPPSTSEEFDLLGIFTRLIKIEDDEIDIDGDSTVDAICAKPDTGSSLDYTNIKRVTVTVQWQSPIGAQEREVTSCIADI